MGSNPTQSTYKITNEAIGEYISFLGLKGVTKGHINEVGRYLRNYKKYILSNINKASSLEYFKLLQKNNSIAYYKRQMFQLRRFLQFLKVEWATEITLLPDPYYTPIRITAESIKNSIQYFSKDTSFNRIKALILLGCTSGLRATELYCLTKEDIDLKQRIIYVNHNEKTNHTTKNKRSRVSFFTDNAKIALEEYLKYYNDCSKFRKLFAKKSIERKFRNAPIKVKFLRKFFSQEWDRRGGPTSIKKILMGHSLRGDVDLMHYNAQSPEDLKKIYDKIME